MDKLDKEQFAVSHYLQSLLKAPEVQPGTVEATPEGEKIKLMSFRVGRLKCAIENRHLAGIQPVLEQPTPFSCPTPAWLPGYMAESVHRAQIIDLKTLVHGGEGGQPLRDEQRLVALRKGRFALVADEVLGGETIYDSEVTWQQESSHRPWLAGVARERNLVILDVDKLEEMLQGDWNESC